jgi:hypothetical protein
MIGRAQDLGLATVILPLIEVESGSARDWRGVLEPHDEAVFWKSYGDFITHYAHVARREGADVLVIGSELTSLSSSDRADRWRAIAARARSQFGGRIAYVANHDALDHRTPFAAVDVAGVSAYFPLGEDGDVTLGEMRSRWRRISGELTAFAESVGKPLVLFELGYPSVDGGAARPWDYTGGTVIDLEEQRDAYLAASEAIHATPAIRGVFFWTWFGEGGPHDRWYTPRNKPAEAILRSFFEHWRDKPPPPR